MGMSGLLQEVRLYCEEWKVPDVTKVQILKKTLDHEAKKHFTYKVWRSLLGSKKVNVRMAPEKTSSRAYFMSTANRLHIVLADS